MKKETTIIVTAELTKHYDAKVLDEIETFKETVKEEYLKGLKNDIPQFDNINITNVQVFELEKEERISTEDLIYAAKKCCVAGGKCEECVFYEQEKCADNLTEALADRLEELNNQQTATPTEQPKAKITKREYVLNNLHIFNYAKKENINEDNILGYCPSDFGFTDKCGTYNNCEDCWNSLCVKDGDKE